MAQSCQYHLGHFFCLRSSNGSKHFGIYLDTGTAKIHTNLFFLENIQQLGIQKARQTKWLPAYKAKRGPLLRFPFRLAVAIAATNRVAVKKAEEKKGKSYPPSQREAPVTLAARASKPAAP